MTRVIAICSLALVLGCGESGENMTTDTTPAAGTEIVDAKPVMYETGQTLIVNVPDMHCPFVCYPKVKETLAGQPGVGGDEAVDLVEQEEEGVIDTPQLIVKLNGEFDSEQAFAALKEAGFEGATIVSVE